MFNRRPFVALSLFVAGMPLCVLKSNLAHAGDVSDIEVSAEVFAHWGYDLKPTPYEGYVDGDPRPNAFDVDRAFLGVGSRVDETFSVQLRTDVAREESGRLGLLLRHAYLQVDLTEGMFLKFGSAENAMNKMSDEFWSHDWVARPFASENDVNNEADLGVYAFGKHADGLLSWGAAVVNGEGYDNIDDDHDKAVQARLTVDPMHGEMKLPISVYVSQDVYTRRDVAGHTVLIASLGFDQEYANVWGEYVIDTAGKSKGSGMSFSLVGKIPDVLNVVGRYDIWDPDANSEKDEHTTMRAGLTKDFLKVVSAGLMYEHTTHAADPDQPDKGLFFRMSAGF